MRARDLGPRRRHLAASCALALYTAVAHAPLLAAGRAPWSAHSDVIALDLFWKQALAQAAARGDHRPLFQDAWLVGGPLLAHPQALALHPLHALFHLARPEAAVGPTLALLFFVAALGTYALARALGASFGASLLVGASASTSFKLVAAAYAGWVGALCPIVLVPWLLAACVAHGAEGSRRSLWWLSVAAALAFAGPSPQVPLYALGLALPWLLAPPEAAPRRWLAAAGVAPAVALGLACSAYLWLPVVADLPALTRSHTTYGDFLAGHAVGLAQLRTFLDAEALGSPLDHTYPGEELWEDVAYFGLLPLLLAALALARAREHRAHRVLGAVFLASVALACTTPLTRALFAALPGYGALRLPGRMLFVTSFLGLGLAALGADHACRWVGERTRRRVTPALAAAAFVLVAVDGVPAARAYLSTRPASALLPAPDHPLRALPPAAPNAAHRTLALTRAPLTYGWAGALGLHLVNGNSSYQYAHLQQYVALLSAGRPRAARAANFLDARSIARRDLLDALSVRYVIAPRPAAIPETRAVVAGASPDGFHLYRGLRPTPLFVYENRAALPRLRFAPRVLAVASDAEALAAVARTDLRAAAVVVGASLPTDGPTQAAVTLDQSAPGHLALRTRADRPGVLLASELYHPGWRASVDGRPSPVLRANLSFVGVPLPAGEHRVALRFDPPSARAGQRVSVAALLLLSALGVAAHRRREPPRR